MSNLTREVKFVPAYNRMEAGHGRNGAEVYFYLKGPEGVVQFRVISILISTSVRSVSL